MDSLDMMWVWMILFLGFGVFEFITPGNLITIWFAFGSLGGLITQQLNLPLPIQILSFILISFASFLLVRPFAKKVMRGETIATNADRLIGQQFRLEKDYDPKEWYQQKINSEVWSIVNAKHESINANTLVEIVSIDGVKLVVRQIKEENHA